MAAKNFDYDFKDRSLFELAMTQAGSNSKCNNERLEFLGDRVLGLATATILYKMYPSEAEGELARRQAILVSAKTLAGVAKSFGFDKTVKHGHMTGGKIDRIAANAMESVIAAVYLDGGWDSAFRFIESEWVALAGAHDVAPKDPKTELQELAQHTGDGKLPYYEVEMDPKNRFNVRVIAMGKAANGYGTTKKSATADAAKHLLEILKKKKSPSQA